MKCIWFGRVKLKWLGFRGFGLRGLRLRDFGLRGLRLRHLRLRLRLRHLRLRLRLRHLRLRRFGLCDFWLRSYVLALGSRPHGRCFRRRRAYFVAVC